MIRLQKERQERGWSQSQLSYEARVGASYISQAESGRRKPYPRELARLAAALEWDGSPEALLETVTLDACNESS